MSLISGQITWTRNANQLLICKRCVMCSRSSKLSGDVLHNNLLCENKKTTTTKSRFSKVESVCRRIRHQCHFDLNVCGFFRPRNLFSNKCPMWRDMPCCEKLQNKTKHLKIRVNSACHYPRPALVCFSCAIKSAGRI